MDVVNAVGRGARRVTGVEINGSILELMHGKRGAEGQATDARIG